MATAAGSTARAATGSSSGSTMAAPSLRARIWRERWMYLFIVPGALYFLVFEYLPLLGNVIAFQDYSPFLGITGIPSTVKDPERIKELLRVLDYLASPFGSGEWRFLQYGIEGVDHTLKDGVPVLNERGIAERGDLVYLMANMPVLFYPQDPGAVEPAQKLAHEINKIGIDDPSWPLYSPTNVSKLAELRQFGFDRVTEIVTGRAPLTAIDHMVKEWKSRGGDRRARNSSRR